jgi:D-alanyl-D-alanine carboxypeptidase
VRRFLPRNDDRRDDDETDRAWCDADTRTAADGQRVANGIVDPAISGSTVVVETKRPNMPPQILL